MKIVKAPKQEIFVGEAKAFDLKINVLRLDLVHPEIGGNKWFKLKYNLNYAVEKQVPIVTFGGAYSNHIAAVAAAGKLNNIKTFGIIRGESTDNPTLNKAEADGMKLFFVSRETYKLKDTTEFISKAEELIGLNDFHLIPEGGNNNLGFNGASEILTDIADFDYVCVACGTGTTLAGVISSLSPNQHAIGFTVLKNKQEIIRNVCGYIQDEKLQNLFSVTDRFHFGGYAKFNQDLLKFITEFEATYSIPLDHVYTGKLFFGAIQLIKENFFKKNSRILIIHTGGLQGKLK